MFVVIRLVCVILVNVAVSMKYSEGEIVAVLLIIIWTVPIITVRIVRIIMLALFSLEYLMSMLSARMLPLSFKRSYSSFRPKA